jgi:hypothetical protein
MRKIPPTERCGDGQQRCLLRCPQCFIVGTEVPGGFACAVAVCPRQFVPLKQAEALKAMQIAGEGFGSMPLRQAEARPGAEAT